MKNILFFILFTICFGAVQGQPPKYTSINGRFNYQFLRIDSALHLPRIYSLTKIDADTTPSISVKDSNLVLYSNGKYRQIGWAPSSITMHTADSCTVPSSTFINGLFINAATATTLKIGTAAGLADILSDTYISSSGVLASIMIAPSTTFFVTFTGSTITLLIKK